MTEIASYDRDGEIGIVTIDSKPVNALGIAVRRAIAEGFDRFSTDADIRAIVLICGGRTFFAGADISEFGKAPEKPDLHDILHLIEDAGKPVFAAIHGTALGGGLEVALTCNYRIALPSAKVGLPEVHLGLLPGAGGTQRLPRIVGPELALDLIANGRQINAKKALELGVIDALAQEGELRADAVAFARTVLARGEAIARVRDRQDKIDPFKGKPELFDDYLKANARGFRGFKAPGNIVRAVQAAVDLPFEEGLKRERELFRELHDSSESAAQRYYFFAERQTSKIPDLANDIATLPIKSVGVIGAGTMGGGISMNFLNAGIPVTLVEMSQEALDRGISVIRRNYENTAKKGRLTQEQVEQRMALIQPSTDIAALADVDLVIEAVFERMDVKKEIFAKLDQVAKKGAILASNTSFLDLDEIAAATSRPGDVIGLHFFSPANVMRLLEIVRGKQTRDVILATAVKMARTIGKVPVVSKVCHGFIANRIMEPRGRQADAVILEGTSPEAVDKAIYDYGFAMGPFAMLDLIGLDVLGRGSSERTLMGDLVALDRLGQKKNGGFYDYDEKRRPTPSPVAAKVIADLAAAKGIEQSDPLDADEIVARLLYPVVNEGARILEEGVAIRASDIDVACILGYNWPVYTGGPMFWADMVGLPKIVAALDKMAERYGEAFAPAALLREKASNGGSFTRS
ncbi:MULTISPECIES: 3-hydroxyacyl-CoA dehydrogenase NAD-binding domain-containing protein [Sphingobium]|uniref:3-hydroxyacyl-CoA dehydrogenase NAD-binding domain-containing protein n=1 Tax=Sphingobium TaxID=165695 RepID=UPI00159BFD1D|nr:3-hydroxyacyl-CoA dehydrogenase NAD-binding domain-containing protein [Sphingobium sp. 15-1]